MAKASAATCASASEPVELALHLIRKYPYDRQHLQLLQSKTANLRDAVHSQAAADLFAVKPTERTQLTEQSAAQP